MLRTRLVTTGVLAVTLLVVAALPHVPPLANYLFPFVAPKVFLLSTLCALVAAVTIATVPAGARRWRWTPLRGAVALTLASAAISALAGVDLRRSLWSSHERLLGFVTLAHLGALFFAVTALGRGAPTKPAGELPSWRRPVQLVVAAWGLVCVVGLLQKWNPDLLQNNGATRVSAALGHPSYLGALGLVVAFGGLFLVLTESRRAFKVTFGLLAGVAMAAIFASETRGSQFGLAVGVVTVLGTSAIVSTGRRRAVLSCVTGVLIGATCGVGFLCFGAGENSWWSEVPGLRRFANLSLSGGTLETRLMAWSIAWDAWQDRPFFGWGISNYYYAFVHHFRPEFLNHNWHETWFDDAHSIPLNTLATQGLFGVVSYAVLFATATWQLFKNRKSSPALFVAGTAYLAAHFGHSLFVFESVTSYLGLLLFIAFVDVVTAGPAEPWSGRTPIARLVVAVVIGGCIAWFVNVPAAAGNRATLVAYTHVHGDGAHQAINSALETATPHHHDVVDQLAGFVVQAAPTYLQAGRQAECERLLELVHTALEESCAARPLDLRGRLLFCQVAQLRVKLGAPRALLDSARVALDQALEFGPTRPDAHFLMASLDAQRGDYAAGLERLRVFCERFPNVMEANWRLANAYHQTGQLDAAWRVIEAARARGIVFRGPGRGVVAAIETARAKQLQGR